MQSFENPVKFHYNNQGGIVIMVTLQMQPRTKHI